MGCATQKPVCRHEALATAIMYIEQGKTVRIISYGFSGKKRHAEPQVLTKEGWKYIRMDCNENVLYGESWHSKQFNIEYYEIHEYLLHLGIKLGWQ
jgi:hypothetical protein